MLYVIALAISEATVTVQATPANSGTTMKPNLVTLTALEVALDQILNVLSGFSKLLSEKDFFPSSF